MDLIHFRLSSLVWTVLSLVTLLACGKVSTKAIPQPETSDAVANGGSIKLSETVEFEGDGGAYPTAPSPYTHGAEVRYQLMIEKEVIVTFAEGGSSTACLENLDSAGPFITIHKSDSEIITSDSVRYPDKAVSPHEFKFALKPGTYLFQVNFYTTGPECFATYAFSFKGSDTQVDDAGKIVDEENGDPEDQAPLFDTELVGKWAYQGEEDIFNLRVLQKLEFKADATATSKITFGQDTIYEVDYTIIPKAKGDHKRLEMKVKTVHVDESDEPVSAGDVFQCIYHVDKDTNPLVLKLACNDINDNNFPGDFENAEEYSPWNESIEPPEGPVSVVLTNLSLAIPDANANGITQEIIVSENRKISSLSVSVDITHTYRGDLQVVLVHPSGLEIMLHNRLGGSAANLQASYGVGGSVQSVSFDPLKDLDAAGTWKLRVSDLELGDAGIVNGVTLTINPSRR